MTIRKLFWLICLVLSSSAMAQTQSDKGMSFIHADNWKEVIAKARAENKYIFVDAYTTWCGPCKYMAANIFPQENVGEFYNDKFINVKVQLDTTKKDDDYTRSWYADAHYIMTHYGVQVFPTYLFLDPTGKLVHRAVGSSDGETFIGKGKDALDPNKQYYTLKERYDNGDRNTDLLYNVTLASLQAYDRANSKKYMEAYAATQSNMLTKENIELLQLSTQSTKDIGFTYMMNNPAAFNEVAGKSYAESATRMMIMQEEIYKDMWAKDKKPDWSAMQQKVATKYPARAEEVISYAKAFYYQNTGDWDNFSMAISAFMDKYKGDVPYAQMNSFAWSVFQNCSDPSCVDKALTWSRAAAEATQDPSHYDTYANLLLKSGNQPEAIRVQEQAIALAKANGSASVADYEETLEKIKKGEKTWN